MFVARSGKTHCASCTARRLECLELIEKAIEEHHFDKAEDIASFTGLPLEEVEEIVKDTPSLRHVVRSEVPCKRCGKKPAQAGSRYCLKCRLTLNRELGRAAAAVMTRIRITARQLIGPVRFGRLITPPAFEAKRRETARKKGAFTARGRWSP